MHLQLQIIVQMQLMKDLIKHYILDVELIIFVIIDYVVIMVFHVKIIHLLRIIYKNVVIIVKLQIQLKKDVLI